MYKENFKFGINRKIFIGMRLVEDFMRKITITRIAHTLLSKKDSRVSCSRRLNAFKLDLNFVNHICIMLDCWNQ